jgi:RHS repeat-associated protein
MLSNGAQDYGFLRAMPSLTALRLGIVVPGHGIWYNAKSLGLPSSSCPMPGAVACGNPIDIGSGNKFEQVTDYTTAGQNPLAFIRYYNSMATADTLATTLGRNWRSNYDRYLHIISPSAIYGVEAERPNGQVINFSSSSGIYTPDTDVDVKLTKSGSTWTLTDHQDTVETYTASGSTATLNSIARRNGYSQTLSYSSAGHLSSVSDTYSRSLGLSYTSAGLLTGVTTPDSLALSYGYIHFSSASLLSTVSYNSSPATHQTYLYENASYPFALTGITDENGNRYATWGYDGFGRANLSEHAGGADETQISYSSAGNVVTGPLGIQETYKFTTLQGTPKVTEIDRAANGTVASATRTLSYDSAGYLAHATDWNGNSTAYTNNSHGDPTQIVYASGNAVSHTTSIAYNSTWVHLPATVTTPGVTEALSYDSSGNLTSRTLTDTTATSTPYSTNGQARTWAFTYTSSGQLASAQLPRVDVTAKTTYGYTGGTLTSVTDALSHVTLVHSHTGGGLPLIVTDPNNARTVFTYNNRNWLTGSTLYTSAGSYATSIQYDSAGNLTKETLPDGTYLSYGYDQAHRLTSITNPLSEKEAITYNSGGNLTQALWKNASSVTKRQHTASFDALGRMLTDVGGVSQTTHYTYDKNSNALTITDPLGNVTTQTFDALNRLSTTKDQLGDQTGFTYDAHDRVLTVTDPRSKVTSYVYNGFGDRIETVSPDSGTTVWYYDPDRNVTTRKDGAINFTSATYDALDRILTRTYPADSSENVAFTYDQTGHGYGIGHLTSMTDAAGSLSQTWDQRGNLTVSTRTISSKNYKTDYSYQSAGRLSSITYASAGWLATYSRDSAGQVSGVSTTQPGHGATNVATSITHLPFGPVASLTFGNGMTDARTFDLDYRMTGVKDKSTGNIYYTSAGYDADNNITSVTDHVTSANSQALKYDSAGRLSFASSGSYAAGTITYDSSSNRLSYGGTSYTISPSSNRMTVAGGTSISYTSAGNMSAIGTSSLSYNKAEQLSSATVSGTTSAYVYDGFGQRLKVTVGAGTPIIQSYGQGGALLSELQSTTAETDYIYLDGFPVGVVDAHGVHIYDAQTNWLGTPQKVTNSSRTVVWTGAYQPFGAVTPTASITMNLRLPGQYSDATGYYHNGFRDYIPAYGRYAESDPVGLLGGTNTYSYVANNPLKYTDPLGLLPKFIQNKLEPADRQALQDNFNQALGNPFSPDEAKQLTQAVLDNMSVFQASDFVKNLLSSQPEPNFDPQNITQEQLRDLNDILSQIKGPLGEKARAEFQNALDKGICRVAP